MSKTVKLRIDKPIIKNGMPLEHIATSWEVSKIPDFSNPDMLVAQSLRDEVSLLEFNQAIEKNETLYFRTRFHFTGNKASSWSNITPVRSDQIGIKMSGTVVATPVVTYEVNYDNSDAGQLILKTNDMRLFAGIGDHKYTSWVIIDSDGHTVYDRYKDEDNLTEIVLDGSILKENKAYIIKAKHFTNTNAESNYGKFVLSTYTYGYALFDLITPWPLVPNQWLYFNLRLYTTRFSWIDIIIKDELGNIVAENKQQTSRTPRIYTGELKPYYRYSVYARIRLNNNVYSEYRHIFTSMIKTNELIDFKSDQQYLDKQSFSQELLLNGLTSQTSREIYTGTVLLGKHHDSNLYRYRIINGRLNEVGPVITLDNAPLMDKPYINIIPLYSGRILVDYSSDKLSNKYRRSIFKLYEYNTITHNFTLINENIRTNEFYSTGLSTSLDVVDKNSVYYIPNKELDNQDQEVDLKLKKLDLETFDIEEVSSLPVSIKRFPTLVKLDKDRLLFMGGSGEVRTDGDFEDWETHTDRWYRDNNKIFIYSISNDTWTEIAEFPLEYPKSIYNLQAFMRRDGKVVIFNGVNSGNSVGNQMTAIFDPDTFNFTIDDNDFNDDAIYRNSAVLMNGDILRLSTRALDPQKVYTYVSDTMTEDEVGDNSSIDIIKDLVIPMNEVITIESPYRYDSITIEGDSYDNSGLLRWLDGDKIREFKYRDLIITRDTTLRQNLYVGVEDWDSITVLDGAELFYYNYIHVPENKDFVIDAAVEVEEIIIDSGSTLTVNHD